MIKVRKIKTKRGFIYEAKATQRGLTARASKKKTALKRLVRKIDMAECIDRIKDFLKKSLRIK